MQLAYTESYLLSLDPERRVTVSWLARAGCTGEMEYGASPELLTCRAIAEAHKITGLRAPASGGEYAERPEQNPELDVVRLSAELTGEPGQKLYYRTHTHRDGADEAGSVYDCRFIPKGEDVSFLIVSDLQCFDGCETTVAAAGKHEFDFMFYCGDFVNWCWHASEWFPIDGVPSTGQEFFKVMTQAAGGCSLMQRRLFYPCPGNHDTDDYLSAGHNKEACLRGESWRWSIYMQLFAPLYPGREYGLGGRRWYSANVGKMHIVSLSAQRWADWDAYDYPGWLVRDDISAGSPQARWLEEDLKGADSPFKWVIMHWHMMNRGDDVQVPFCAPAYDGKAVSYPQDDCETVLRPLFEKYRVSGVSFGHSHVYERYFVHNVTYLEAAYFARCYHPPGKEYAPHPTGYLPICENNLYRSYCIISTNGSELTGTARGAESGEVFDSWSQN